MIPLPTLPGMGAGLPSISTGPAVSGATSSAGLSTAIISPFTFDNSNWQVQVKSSGSQSATSSSGADVSGPFGASGGSAGLGGLDLKWILLGAGAWLLFQ